MVLHGTGNPHNARIGGGPVLPNSPKGTISWYFWVSFGTIQPGTSGAPDRRITVFVATTHKVWRDVGEMETMAQLGVTHMAFVLPEPWRQWTAEKLIEFREECESLGVTLEAVKFPFTSRPANEDEVPHVFGPPTDARDREIDQLCEYMYDVHRAGIPTIQYAITLSGGLRTAPTRGRGGVKLSTFRYSELDHDLPPLEDPPLDADEVWERIDHFLGRVVPVAEELRLPIACHPEDPSIGDRMYRGVPRVMGTVDGIKRFIELHESPYHGLNFCQGTVSEMLENPAEEIFDLIRYFGERRKIFNVHFRNIRGEVLDFVEVYPEEGDIDMVKALRTYKGVGYDGMIMPDHVPYVSGAEPRRIAMAYAYGYIRALIQVVESE